MIRFLDELWHGWDPPRPAQRRPPPRAERELPRGAVRLSRAARGPARAPCLRFRTASLEKTAEGQSARRAASKLQALGEEKGQCAFANSKALLQAQRLTGEGERELKPRFNRVGSQAVGAPPGQKGLSAGEEAAPGLGGSIKGSCVPAALKFTFVF